MNEKRNKPQSVFQQLTPDRVFDLVESELDIRCNNLFRPLNSYINRVFELETFEGERLIAKFYRPGRWSEEAILDEHRFLGDLVAAELPVIAPFYLKNGQTLAARDDLNFALFPKCGGRSIDEFNDDQWLQLGRLLGRMHQVGAIGKADHRIVIEPNNSSRNHLEYLLSANCVPAELKPSLEKTVVSIIEDIDTFFRSVDQIRIHGDCHFSNVIHRPGDSLYLIDFDDMATGPAVQDIWMLLPGELNDAIIEFDLFLEGYETFRPFDRRELRLIEPLRAMRFVHYMAWCAHQVEEDGETRAIDGFGSWEYWQTEIEDLRDQQQRIEDDSPTLGNSL